MPLFKNIKRAFGFSDPMDECEDFVGIDATVVPLSARKNNNEDDKSQSQPSRQGHRESEDAGIAEKPEDPAAAQKMIFESVIKIFNDALPDFLQKTVDGTSQRDYIYNALDVSLKSYLNNVEENARRTVKASWDRERQRLEAENREISDKFKSLSEKAEDSNKNKLSAERQKRALAERVHDLEMQIATLEADKEQYELENKSLLNKLRLSALQSGEDVSAYAQISGDGELQSKLDELQAQYDSLQASNNELQAVRDSLQSQIEELQTQRDEIIAKHEQLQSQYDELQSKLAETSSGDSELQSKHDEALVQLTDTKAKLEETTAKLDLANKTIEEMKMQAEIADTMINNLNSKASEAIHDSDEASLSLKEAQRERDEANNQVVSLKEKLAAATQEIDSLQEEMEEAREAIGMLDEIQEQVSQFEEIKQSSDKRISELSSENSRLLQVVDSLKAEKESLKKEKESLSRTIESNLYAQAESEKKLLGQIENLNSQLTGSVPSIKDIPEETKPARRKNKNKISAIDESVGDIDWLVAADEDDLKPIVSEPDENFGYQEPAKKKQPENDAQMSLF